MFRLALRQTEGLIRSILCLLGLDLAVPDHSTMSRRARSLELPRIRPGRRAVHLLVDSTGLRLCGPGEWLVERHGSRTRRLWRKLHLATDADTGEIAATELTEHDADDGGQVEALLDSYGGPIASFTADGAYDRDDVYAAVAARSRRAAVVIPPRSSAVPSAAANAEPTQRDEHIAVVAAHGRMGWQRRSGYNWRALVEADVSRWKRVIGDALRLRTDDRRSPIDGSRCRSSRAQPNVGAGTAGVRAHGMNEAGDAGMCGHCRSVQHGRLISAKQVVAV